MQADWLCVLRVSNDTGLINRQLIPIPITPSRIGPKPLWGVKGTVSAHQRVRSEPADVLTQPKTQLGPGSQQPRFGGSHGNTQLLSDIRHRKPFDIPSQKDAPEEWWNFSDLAMQQARHLFAAE